MTEEKIRLDVLVGTRITKEEREAFRKHAEVLSRTPSQLLRNYIRRVIRTKGEYH